MGMSFFLGPNVALIVVLASFLVLGIVIFGVRTSAKTKFSIISIFLALSIFMTIVSCSDWNSLKDSQNIYTSSTSGSLTFYDSLNGKDTNGWDTGYSNCQFNNGVYDVTSPTASEGYSYDEECLNENTHFRNFAYQVRMKFIQGDQGCVIFRYIVSSSGTTTYDLFCIGSNGNYVFLKNNNDQIEGSSAAINSGVGQINYVAIVAQGTKFTMFVNTKFVTTVQDNTSAKEGLIGVGAISDQNATKIAFSYAQVWRL